MVHGTPGDLLGSCALWLVQPGIGGASCADGLVNASDGDVVGLADELFRSDAGEYVSAA